jgi:tetratricopeptide (TPR) repeat protein
MPLTEDQFDSEADGASGAEIEPSASSPTGSKFSFANLRHSKLVLAGASACALCVLVGTVWTLSRDEGPSASQRCATALRLLNDRANPEAWHNARKMAQDLDRADFRDPEFSGATEFILGIADFRDANSTWEMDRERLYLKAARYLQATENRGLPDERRPEWAYVLGTALHKIGSISEARPRLEEAVVTFEPGRLVAATLLVESYLDTRTPEELAKALELNTAILETPDLDEMKRDRAYLQQAQIYLALGRNSDAAESIKRVSETATGDNQTTLFRAQTMMAEGKYSEAMSILEPIKNEIGLEREFPRKAAFLIGVCHEKLDNIDQAISVHSATSATYKESHEGLAASLRLADLLLNQKSDEKALQAYRGALDQVRRPEDFHNPWLSLEEFRRVIRAAWNTWAQRHSYREAIALSNAMTPLLPDVEAFRLAAIANQRWAEHLEAELSHAPYSEQKRRKQELLEHWQLSAKDFSKLANSLKTSAEYPGTLWISALHYRRGHDFENALRQITRFINTQPNKLLPLAIVRRGEILMDLDRLKGEDSPLEHFRRVVDNYRTDPAAFEAQYLIGKCHLERNEWQEAEASWRQILTSEALTPAANEWRLALFSLGRLLYHTAEMLHAQSVEPRTNITPDEKAQLVADAFQRWDEAITRLDEFLKRYPDVNESIEARYLLAKALQKNTELPRRKLEEAETDLSRIELRRQMQELLTLAIAQFEVLQVELNEIESRGQLDELGKRMHRDSYFEIAHTHYALDNYSDAITAYSSAANKYPRDPHVLLAYLQMTNCYDRLGQPAEARSMLLQAKVILKDMPDEIWKAQLTNMNAGSWENWIFWARQLHHSIGE